MILYQQVRHSHVWFRSIRPSKPQCIVNINPTPDCGTNGKWVTTIHYASGTLNGFCMCDGVWTNKPINSISNPCTQKVICPYPDNCGEGCNKDGNINCDSKK